MKTIRLSAGIVLLPLTLLIGTVAVAKEIGPVTKRTSVALVQDSSATTHLDNAVAALDKGDKAATTQELQAGITGLETQAKTAPPSFKDKLLSQASKLKALLPLIPDGALGNGVLGKAVSLAKLASGGSKLEGLLAAGSLLGKGSQLTSGLSGISSALSGLGGSTQSSGQSLISKALSTVSKLDQGGLVAKAAEPVAKTEVGGVLNLIKGVL